jgi:hypothetical protein
MRPVTTVELCRRVPRTNFHVAQPLRHSIPPSFPALATRHFLSRRYNIKTCLLNSQNIVRYSLHTPQFKFDHSIITQLPVLQPNT